MNKLGTAICAVVALTFGATACGSSADTAATSKPASDGVQFTGAWARTSPMNAKTGVAYLTITSSIDDNLMSASVDPTVAAKTELHETVPAGAGATESSMMDGATASTESTSMTAATAMPGATSPAGEVAMTMRPVASIAVKAGTALALAPGSYHIMMVDLVAPLQTGKTIELTLTFEKGGVKKITVPIREDAP